jgi:hypothetical protein
MATFSNSKQPLTLQSILLGGKEKATRGSARVVSRGMRIVGCISRTNPEYVQGICDKKPPEGSGPALPDENN